MCICSPIHEPCSLHLWVTFTGLETNKANKSKVNFSSARKDCFSLQPTEMRTRKVQLTNFPCDVLSHHTATSLQASRSNVCVLYVWYSTCGCGCGCMCGGGGPGLMWRVCCLSICLSGGWEKLRRSCVGVCGGRGVGAHSIYMSRGFIVLREVWRKLSWGNNATNDDTHFQLYFYKAGKHDSIVSTMPVPTTPLSVFEAMV